MPQLNMKNKIIAIVLLAFIIRVAAVLIYADFKNDYYWEYGEIAKNIKNGNGYSLFYLENSSLEHKYNDEAEPFKSAYMPPGYVYYLLPFIHIESKEFRNAAILFSHILISTATIYLLFLFTRKLFNETAALLASFIAAILPEFIYAVLSFTPTIIYHFLIISLMLVLLRYDSGKSKIVIPAFLIALIIYFRSEFILFFILFLLLLFILKQYKNLILAAAIVFVMLAPWSIRNYLTFNEFIPMSSSFGLNLYRGHNPYQPGAWGEKRDYATIALTSGNRFEAELNKIYYNDAIKFIKENPAGAVKNIFIKQIYLWLYYPLDARTTNYFYIFPSLFLFIFFIIGILLSIDYSRKKYIYLFLLYSGMVAALFFPLTRYQTMMKIIMIPFSAWGLEQIFSMIKRKKG
jgi:4-amino-4-deoxy-L-arabinose transferase-like glycosyltransferase